jgi:hypothetical protein
MVTLHGNVRRTDIMRYTITSRIAIGSQLQARIVKAQFIRKTSQHHSNMQVQETHIQETHWNCEVYTMQSSSHIRLFILH